jgi:undecaprenyl diphosphate synthase
MFRFLSFLLRRRPVVSRPALDNAGPADDSAPRHVAIIMDGNGRWAKQRHLPRVAGHTRGADIVRQIVERCLDRGVSHLTLFAFSSENWQRPIDEVSVLMRLFVSSLQREVANMVRNGVRLRVVGDLDTFDPALRDLIVQAEADSQHNSRLTLIICASYGGRWDITQAALRLARDCLATGTDPSAQAFEANLALAFAPDPDLLIRTGGEKRISNFLLWQMAYTEMYFTDILWPDFSAQEFDAALAWYTRRERRFGRTSEQVETPVRPE